MPPRSRASLIERRSWKDVPAKTANPTLVYYRRAIATAVSVALLVAFGIAIWFMLWPDPGWIARSVSIDDYDLTTPPVLFARADGAALQETPLWKSSTGSRHEQDIKTLVNLLEQEAKETAPAGRFSKKLPALLIYVTAHGVSQNDEAFLLEAHFDIAERGEQKVPLNDLLKAINDHPAPMKLLVIDSGPLERDLHQGLAVNRFPELLQTAISGLTTEGKAGEFWVLASHRLLESSQIEPALGRSLFSYFFTEGMANSDTNADALGPQKGDGQISLLDLSYYVHHQVAGHVWDASARTRTQTPILIKAGEGPIDLDSETPGAAHAEALDQIVLARVPKKKPAKGEPAATPADKAAPTEAAKSSRRLSAPLTNVTLVHYQPADAQPGSPANGKAPGGESKDSTPADGKQKASSETDPAKATTEQPNEAQTKPAPAKLAAPPSLPPVSKLSKLPPNLAALNREASLLSQQWRQPQPPTDWRALDFAPQYWRGIRDKQLGRQRREVPEELAAPPPAAPGQPGTTSSSVPQISRNDLISQSEEEDVKALGDGLRAPTSDSAFGQTEFRKAIELRNEVFAALPYWIDLQDRLAEDSAKVWNSRLDALLNRLHALCDSLERPMATDSRGATTSEQKIFDDRSQSGQQVCDLRELADDFAELQLARDEAAATLRQLVDRGGLEFKVAPAIARMQRWEVSQSIPLTGEDLAENWVHLSTTKPAKPQAVRQRRAPALTDAANAQQALLTQRFNWLRLQQRLAAFLLLSPTEQDPELAAEIDRIATTGGAVEARAADANRICERLSAAYPRQFSPLSVEADVAQCWQSDRTLRVVPWSLTDRRRLQPTNQPLVLLRVPFKTLDPILVLDGPHGTGPETLATPIALDLKKDIELEWKLSGTELKRLLPAIELRFVYDDDLILVTDLDGKPVRKNAMRVRDAGSLIDKQGRIVVRVRAKQEVNFSAAGAAPATTPTVVGKSQADLRLEVKAEASKQLSSATLFRIPEPGWLAVFVEGQPGTVGQGDTLAADRAPQSFHPSPDRDWLRYPVATPDGVSHVHLTPFPQGSTEYRVGVVNRASKPRTVVCRFFVMPLPDPNQRLVRDRTVLTRHTTRAPRFVSAPMNWEQGSEIVLQVPPVAAPPAAGAAPPPAPASDAPLDLSNGAIYEIQDVADKNWTQLIWITARPQNPERYLTANAQFNFETRQVKVTFRAPSKERLPLGETKVEWDQELRDIRTGTSEMTGNLFAGTPQLSITAQPSEEVAALDEFRAILHCDGYPRAFHFKVPRDGTPAPLIRDGRLKYLDLRVEMDAGDGKEPKWVRLDASNGFFQKPPKLRFELAADVPPAVAAQEEGYLFAVYVTSPGTLESRFYEERNFQVGLQKSMAQPQNFALVSTVDDLRGTISLPQSKVSQKFEIFARIDQRQAGSGKSLLVSNPVPIVIDNEPPKVVIDEDVFFKAQPTMRDKLLVRADATGANVPFAVTDESVSDAEAISGVDPESIQWALAIDARGDLMDAKPVEGVQDGRAVLFLGIETLKTGRNTVYLRARDRAGNWSEVTSAKIEKLPEVKPPAKAG